MGGLWGGTLGRRFYLALLVLFVATLSAWSIVVVRKAREDFVKHSQSVAEKSLGELDRTMREEAGTRAELMEKAVAQLADNLLAGMEDLPLEVFEGQEDRLLEWIAMRLEASRNRTRRNSKVIANLIREESERRLRERVDRLVADSRRESDAWSRTLLKSLLAWSGVFLLGVGALVGLAFHHLVLKPIRQATAVVETMREGTRGRRMPEEGAEELRALARSFNGMAREIEEHQEFLEKRVAEKTKALSEALDEQRTTNVKLREALDQLERAQEQLVEQAKRAALGDMARGMAHEFNNILGGIGGCAEDLLEDVEAPEQKEVIEVILRTARRARIVTENLLSFSRGAPKSIGPTDVFEVLKAAVTLVAPEATRRRIRLELTGERGPTIQTDARGLQQVFLNLLLNAVQATEGGGEIHARFRASESGQCVEIEDSGQGIAENELGRIFESFYSTKSDAAGGGGTGLGLFVSRSIVEGLGGNLRAHSPGLGRGARFTVELPLDAGS
ncbi:MAG TPA: sensor histidine kinase [Planctomycetes bacterium]|nr:sensor histidine kinase [Planctomycetota bacterium]